MIDKVTTIPRNKLGTRIQSLSEKDMTRFGRAIVVFLSLAGS
jgi:mRNA interferase MazF